MYYEWIWRTLQQTDLKIWSFNRHFSEELAEELNHFSNDGKEEVLKNLEITILNKIYTSSYEKHYQELCEVVKKLLEEKDKI